MDPSQISQAAPKRKSTTEPSRADEQTPPAKVRIISSPSTDGSYHHSFELSSEFMTKRDLLFKTMPQQPHLAQLEKSSSSSARKGFRLVLDVDFVHLVEKLSAPFDPIEFHRNIEEYASQIETLELNGYDVVKIRERFDKLKRCSIEAERIRENLKGLKEKKKYKQVEVCIVKNRIDSVKRELKVLEATVKVQRAEIETLDLMRRGYDEEIDKISEEFVAVASAPYSVQAEAGVGEVQGEEEVEIEAATSAPCSEQGGEEGEEEVVSWELLFD